MFFQKSFSTFFVVQQHKIIRILLSDASRERSERFIIGVAIGTFVLHLLLIGLTQLGMTGLNPESEMLSGFIAAIYTPFSFILLYEVYLLVFYLPQSTTTYIAKQYEIVTLIVIRRLFKDIANLELTTDWFAKEYDLQFTYDLLTTLALFGLIYLFYRLNHARPPNPTTGSLTPQVKRFIVLKQYLAVALIPLLAALAVYSLGHWGWVAFGSGGPAGTQLHDINDIFFDDFFAVLILVDVLLLLLSFVLTDQFHTVIRNSGFVISTILIKLSFSVAGLLNAALTVTAVLFGVAILWLHNQYEQLNLGHKQ